MSNTPRTDAVAKIFLLGVKPSLIDYKMMVNLARQLETELAEARKQLVEASIKFKELDHEFGCEHRLYLGLRQQLVERDALVERMRESLIECLDDSNQVLAEYEQLYSATYRPQRLEAQKAVVSEAQAALSLTPSAALAEHDVEVRRKVLEEAAQDKGST